MSTFLSKLRIVTLGTANDLLDKAIDTNSPSAIRQYVRDLEDALAKMQNEAAVAAGTIRTLQRESNDLTSNIQTGKLTIQKLLPANADLARTKATEIVSLQDQLAQHTKDLDAARQSSKALDAAVSNIQIKHDQMLARVRELEHLDRDTKAKEQAAGAMQAAGRLVSGGADMSVDDVESRMRARNDVANAKFDRAVGSTTVQDDPETTAAVDDLLSSLAPKASAATTK